MDESRPDEISVDGATDDEVEVAELPRLTRIGDLATVTEGAYTRGLGDDGVGAGY